MWDAGERAAIFLGPVPEDKLPKDATPGRILVGSLSLSKKEKGNGEVPGKVSVSYRCPLTGCSFLSSSIDAPRSLHNMQ